MTYEEATKYIKANHIYYGVTALEAVNCSVAKFLTEVNGVTILGTMEPVPSLSSKELFPAQ